MHKITKEINNGSVTGIQGHRMVEVGRDHRNSPVHLKAISTMRPGQEVQGLTCLVLKIPKDRDCSTSLAAMFDCPHGGDFFLFIWCVLLLKFTPFESLGFSPFAAVI